MTTAVPSALIDSALRYIAEPKGHFIGGDWRIPAAGERIASIDPSTEATIGSVPEATSDDVGAAVAAAREAFEGGPWAGMNGPQRAKLLWRLADLVAANADELAVIEALDGGKPFRAARHLDIRLAEERLRYYSAGATRLEGRTVPVATPGEAFAYTLREPLGVAALIVPWNAPLVGAVFKLAPALAAGCTVVIKPAELTSMSTLRLMDLVKQAGIPDGVVNVVTGRGATVGAELVRSRGVNKVSFTGSTRVGKDIIRACADNLTRLTLELGGKSPVIVLPDADLKRVVPAVAMGIFANSGQVCTAGSRLFAHRDVYDDLVRGVVEYAKRLKVGPSLDAETDLGPLISEVQRERVLGYVDSALNAGASAFGGEQPQNNAGYFVAPTVLTGTRRDMAVRRDEVFGPVLCVMPFDEGDLETITDEANDTDYGLAANVFTRDLSAAHRLARKIKAGIIKVNGAPGDHALPSGGYKQSGWGREGGVEGIEIYTETKSVVMAL